MSMKLVGAIPIAAILDDAFLGLLVDKIGGHLVTVFPENPGGQVFDQRIPGGASSLISAENLYLQQSSSAACGDDQAAEGSARRPIPAGRT